MSQTLPEIAILLAAFNGEEWLGEQIDSILVQKGVKVHIFISVDFSDDGTYEFCKRLEGIEERISILPYGERFGGAAKNFYRLIVDVNFDSFDYVALSDQDDIWCQDKLDYAVKKISKEKLDAFSSDVIAFWADGRKALVKKSFPLKRYDFLFEAAGPGCTYVFKTSSFDGFKQFLIKNYVSICQVALHDWMIYAYMRNNNMVWLISSYPSMLYRQHSSNQIGFNSGMRAYSKRISLVRRKWYRKEVEKISALLDVEGTGEWQFRVRNFFQLRRRLRDVFALLLMNLFGIY